MMEDNLLNRAISDFRLAKSICTFIGEDDFFVNKAAYHLQQAVELSIKFVFEQEGFQYPHVYNIDQLIRLANENHVNLGITEYIDEHADMFSAWESQTRYCIGFLVETRRIHAAVPEVETWLNNVKERYDQSEQKEEYDLSDEIDISSEGSELQLS